MAATSPDTVPKSRNEDARDIVARFIDDGERAAMEDFGIRLADGTLGGVRWDGRDGVPTVIAVHGITSNALAWRPVADALDGDVQLVAPDLRGRATSAGLPGPYGVGRHADDVIALMDAHGIERGVLAGHSMSGFVVALTALRYPERVSGVVLIDGGVTFAVPDTGDVDAILTAVLGPAMRRLSMTFPAEIDYLDFWAAHPAFAGGLSARTTRHLLRDLTGEEPELRSSCVLDAIRADGRDTLADPDVTSAARRLACPVTMLYAARGMLGETPGLYTAERLSAAGLPGTVTVAPPVDANHYQILLDERPSDVVAAAIREAVRG